MGVRGYYRPCRISGCTTRLAAGHPYSKVHDALPHERCCCGWVGTSVSKHAAQRRRHRPGDSAPHIYAGPATEPRSDVS